MRRRLGGVEGNERLTGATAVLLIALLAVEGITLLFLGRLLSVHVFVGMLLIPPVLLKLGATGYRFMRYYRRRREYTAKGPPPPIMRFLVAPVLVLSTIGVLGTGVLMIAFGRRGISSACTRRASSSGRCLRTSTSSSTCAGCHASYDPTGGPAALLFGQARSARRWSPASRSPR